MSAGMRLRLTAVWLLVALALMVPGFAAASVAHGPVVGVLLPCVVGAALAVVAVYDLIRGGRRG